MKAAVVQVLGQSPAYADFADPVAEPGETLVAVAAAALSPLTRGRAAGRHYSDRSAVPFVAGVDGVGRLEDGRRVYFVLPRAPFGAMARRSVVAPSHCIALPDGLDDVAAAALANPAMSSWAALRERAQLQPGETVLVNGATGSAGRLAVQIARHFGARRVIATGRNPQALAALAADAVITLGDDEATQAQLRAEFARGVDVVVDYLWGRSAEQLLIAAAQSGEAPLRYVEIGAASGGDIKLPAAALRARAIALMGSGIGSVPLERLVDCLRAFFAAAARGGFELPTQAYPLSEVGRRWDEDGAGRTVFTL
jgi:NADPH:quinone reductase-like Zn-dependent oxidoreductase